MTSCFSALRPAAAAAAVPPFEDASTLGLSSPNKMANVQDRGPPSAAAVAIGTAIISVLVGYYVGQARSIGLFGGHPTPRVGRQQVDDDEESDASDAESPGGEVGELKRFADSSEECKMALVTRMDLGMGKGKSGRRFPLPSLPTAISSPARTVQKRCPRTQSDDPATPHARCSSCRESSIDSATAY